jgi:lipopolysaccharide/colanic/teichoic acid biosynthesis glycosyltransferase
MSRLFAALMVAALTPPWLAVAVVILLTDGWPVLFVQRRVGRGGREFRMYKFRTMRAGPGPALTVAGDPRITRLGGFLRRTKLDELPQLLNVIQGDMGFIGARPEVPEFVDGSALWADVLATKPGLFDPAALAFRNEPELLAGADDPAAYYREVILPEKLRLSLEYRRTRGLRPMLRALLPQRHGHGG